MPISPYNVSNDALQDRKALLARAYRHPIAPGCDIGQDVDLPTPPPSTPDQRRSSLVQVPINVATAGDNPLISTLTGRKLIYEIVLWNVAAQTLQLYQGGTGGILLLQLTNFPALSMFTLGFNGSWEEPHFNIDPGAAFVLNLQNSTQVDGMIRYRVATDGF